MPLQRPLGARANLFKVLPLIIAPMQGGLSPASPVEYAGPYILVSLLSRGGEVVVGAP
jgi:hypothetical protein